MFRGKTWTTYEENVDVALLQPVRQKLGAEAMSYQEDSFYSGTL